jgi:hypothetical protein
MADWRAYFGPEYELKDDPYIAEIVTADDLILDYECNYEWLGKSAEEGQAVVAWVKRELLSYELETLFRWWCL